MSSLRTPLDSHLRSLELLFDPDALSSLFNRPVRAAHLRWKRGRSAVARLHDDDGGVRWLAMYSTDSSVKLEKTFRRALTQDVEWERFALDDGILASGPIALDPRLYPVLRGFRRAGLEVPSPGFGVLKYNPFRRLVFSVDAAGTPRLIGRASADGHSITPGLLSELADGGVPVVVPLDSALLPPGLPTSKHLEYLPWYGSGDLSTVPLQVAELPARSAGKALALLHDQAPIHKTHAWRAPAGRLRSLIRENAELIPENGGRLERVSAELEALLRRPGRAALIHGDFSADQVLVDGRQVRLIDFEWSTYGAAASDLGSFAAAEALESPRADGRTVLGLPRTAALLNGYGTGPATVHDSETVAWTAFHLLNRLREPFRACAPDWRQQVDRRLTMIEEVLW